MAADPGGGPPAGGWQPLVPELIVADLAASLAFWRDLLGFAVAYQRPAERFVYLERAGAQVMLRRRDGKWETAPLEPPLGRGVMFQIEVDDVDALTAALAVAGWPLHAGPREAWRQAGAERIGQREIFVLDPDGYLLMLAQALAGRGRQGLKSRQRREGGG